MSNDNATARLALPLLAAGQAQKETTHNEALTLLDMLVQPAVSALGTAEPESPAIGSLWIVGSAPTGSWSGHAGAVAAWTSGGWRFAAPLDGMTMWSLADRCTVQFVDGAWQTGVVRAHQLMIDGVGVVGAQVAAIASPAAGAIADIEARTAIGAILAAMRQHGLIAT